MTFSDNDILAAALYTLVIFAVGFGLGAWFGYKDGQEDAQPHRDSRGRFKKSA